MARQYIVIGLIAALILFSGCATQQKKTLTDPFIGGNTAVNLYLQNGAPPPQVYDGGQFPFPVNVVLENVGESDIGPGTENPYVTAKLENIDPVNFGITENDLEIVLNDRVNGAHKNTLDGTIIGGQPTNFLFQNLNYKGHLVGDTPITIRGAVCYDYSNVATAQLCMKSDILENVQDSTLCNLAGQPTVYNSGGPIHITQLTQNPEGPYKIMVTFNIEHVGPGEFYGRTPHEDCDPSSRNMNKYGVGVTLSVQDPNTVVQCYRLNNSNSGNITMYSGEPQTISCTVQRLTNTSARIYTDTMTIKTYYRYGQFIEQPIMIVAAPTQS